MDWLTYASLGIAAAALLAAVLLRGRAGDDGALRLLDALDRLERRLRDEMSAAREEAGQSAAALRQEVGNALKGLAEIQKGSLDGFGGQMSHLTRTLDQRLDSFTRQIADLTRANDERQEALRASVENRLGKLQEDNAARLEQMRQTVDEKLQGTLERRLGESFRLVSERLEQVQKGLGEMQSLASGVGDLKRVLTNVKTRGTWGEMQLASLLEQMLTPDQFTANGICRVGSAERVDFAIRLPGRGDDGGEVLLPIDSKFPQEDYDRLLDAAERADAEAVEAAGRALEQRVKSFARDIRAKYVNPPRTTDFAILFLPTEGLYAEILRRPGLADQLQQDFRVTVCGPTTLGALLNSLQMGFRTLAIERQSGAVWEVLGAVKTEFAKYGEVLEKVQRKLSEASDSITHIAVRKRAIDRSLKAVTELPAGPAEALLGLGAPLDDGGSAPDPDAPKI
ncbi:MAG: DNA recombination protein RmuC [Telmatospirillum sp.]|nr:DNA recombination protein RmuC [Telmatospirillum sp.]